MATTNNLTRFVVLALVAGGFFFFVSGRLVGWAPNVPLKALPPRTTIESDDDARCLLQNHPELAQRVGGDLAAAKQYYEDQGFAQGLSGACPQTDEDAALYIDAYEDLREVLGKDRDRLRKAKEHWVKYGWRQGRIGHARFKIFMAADAAGRAQRDAHELHRDTMYLDPAVKIAEKQAKEEAKKAQAASALNKVVTLKSARTGAACATDPQGLVACQGGGPESFQLEKMSADAFVLRTNRTNQYCQVGGADQRVRCDVASPADASQFKYIQGAPGSSRFRMVSLQTGRACDHDDRALVCNFPETPDGALEFGVVSATIQTDNTQAKIQYGLENQVQPHISTHKYGERAYGKEEETGLSLAQVAAVASAALVVGVGGFLAARRVLRKKAYIRSTGMP